MLIRAFAIPLAVMNTLSGNLLVVSIAVGVVAFADAARLTKLPAVHYQVRRRGIHIVSGPLCSFNFSTLDKATHPCSYSESVMLSPTFHRPDPPRTWTSSFPPPWPSFPNSAHPRAPPPAAACAPHLSSIRAPAPDDSFSARSATVASFRRLRRSRLPWHPSRSFRTRTSRRSPRRSCVASPALGTTGRRFGPPMAVL